MARHHDVVAVHRLRGLARADVDRGHAREQAPAVEHLLDDGSTFGCTRHRLEHRVLGEEVVHPPGRVALGRRSLRLDVQLALEPADGVAQVDDEIGLDGVLDDRVAVDVDTGEMVENRGSGLRHRDTIVDVEPLDNPVWHALTGPHARFSEGSSLALRYQPDVAAFSALPDEVGRRRLGARWPRSSGPGGAAVIFRPATVAVPADWTVADPHGLAADDRHRDVRRTRPDLHRARRRRCRRHARAGRAHASRPVLAPDGRARHVSRPSLRAGRASRRHGRRAGASRGLHRDERGVHRRRGPQARAGDAGSMRAVAAGIEARGETPILHVLADNHSAIRVYEALASTVRAAFQTLIVQAPDRPPS